MKIDELVLSLVLDVAGLKKGQAATEAALVAIRSESEKTDKSMQAGAKKNAEAQKKQGDAIAKNSKETEKADKKTQDGAKNNTHSYGKWLASILSIGAAMVALNKFKNFATDLTNSDAAAGRMAANIGMAVEDLNALGGAADRLGGSEEAMTADLFKFSQAIVKIRAMGELPDFLTDPKGFFKMGGDLLPQLLDERISVIDKVHMLQERMQKNTMPVNQASMGALGWSQSSITAMGNPTFRAQEADRHRLNNLTDADARLAQKRQIAWKRVQDTVESLGRGVTTKLSPAFLKVSDALVKFLSNGENLKKFQHIVDSIVNAITGLFNIIDKAVSGISQLLDLVTGNKAADKGFLGNMLSILNKIADVIDYIIGGYRQIGELIAAEQAAPPAPTMLNGYNPSGKNRSAVDATKDVVLGVNNDLAQSMVALGKLMWSQMPDSTQTTWNRSHPVPTTGQRVTPAASGTIPPVGRATGSATGSAVPTAGQRASAGTGGTVNNYYNSGNTSNDIKMTVPANQVGAATRSLNAKPLGGMAPALAGGMQ